MSLKENYEEVQGRIKSACEKSNRDPSEVTLIAVSKTKPVEMILEMMDLGQRVFGENRVQELIEKYPVVPKDAKFHLIGHLQRNKVKYIIDKVAMIHSVDSLSLAQQISKEAVKAGGVMEILLEVNVAKEESKFGYFPEEVENAVREISQLPGISIVGLMTVAPFTPNPEENRVFFKKLQQLFVDIRSKNIDNVSMKHLSMGMTNDYEIAIEEGATMVRVGTGLFGTRG